MILWKEEKLKEDERENKKRGKEEKGEIRMGEGSVITMKENIE